MKRSSSSSAQPRPGPLGHLRVVDLTDLRGALAGRILGELGADVLKIEPPGGDPERLNPPFAGNVPHPDRSLAFLYRNAGKRGAVLDLDEADDLRRLHELCADADVLIENLGPKGERRHGLTPALVAVKHPRLIHLSISDFGLSGPRAAWRLEALPAFAASGALHASGFPELPPCWMPGYLAHDCASIYAVVGALAALLDRVGHGRGQTIEVSVQEAALNGLNPWSIPLADYAQVYPLLPPSQPRDADGPYLVLPTRDGHVRVLPATPRHFMAFFKLLWRDGAAHELDRAEQAAQAPRALARRLTPNLLSAWLSGLPREAFHLASAALLAASRLVPLPGAALSAAHAITRFARQLAGNALAERARADVLARARELGVPMAPVNTPEQFVAEEQTRVRGYFLRARFPHLRNAPLARSPWNFSLTRTRLSRPAPAIGDDDQQAFVATADDAAAAPVSPRAGAEEKASRAGAGRSQPVLSGTRVINFGVGAAVPELCWLLAELGAEVIKIESRTNPDFLRRVAFEPDAPNRSWMFNDSSRGQKSVCLDLRTPRGRELARKLFAAADVVAENNRGGVARSLGLDYENVRRLKPDIIYLSSQGYGRRGPLGESPAFGPLNSAFAGTNWLWNHVEAPYPAGSSLNHPDHIASKLGVVAVLAALEHRRRTGKGQWIEMAQTEAAAFLMGEFYLEAPLTGRPAQPSGNAAPYASPHGVYPCAGNDRWCAIAVVGDPAWQRFRRALDWPDEPRLATLQGRLAARAELDSRLAIWTRRRTAEEITELLQSAGVSAMTVQSSEDHRNDPHLARRRAIVTIEHPEIGAVHHAANPLRMSRMKMAKPKRAPLLGEHTESVLTSVLGLAKREVRELVASGVCR